MFASGVSKTDRFFTPPKRPSAVLQGHPSMNARRWGNARGGTTVRRDRPGPFTFRSGGGPAGGGGWMRTGAGRGKHRAPCSAVETNDSNEEDKGLSTGVQTQHWIVASQCRGMGCARLSSRSGALSNAGGGKLGASAGRASGSSSLLRGAPARPASLATRRRPAGRARPYARPRRRPGPRRPSQGAGRGRGCSPARARRSGSARTPQRRRRFRRRIRRGAPRRSRYAAWGRGGWAASTRRAPGPGPEPCTSHLPPPLRWRTPPRRSHSPPWLFCFFCTPGTPYRRLHPHTHTHTRQPHHAASHDDFCRGGAAGPLPKSEICSHRSDTLNFSCAASVKFAWGAAGDIPRPDLYGAFHPLGLGTHSPPGLSSHALRGAQRPA
eukprot:TRINITY_DN6659_c0_g2_i7.p1 TRINITY_DN6659_c0_g2~~TRINITY_DN6659_c0_g2_i7.p1  ORF type:complete len:380 (-),score=-100.03 TRINITY_DN6659_c0_g2_i7:491-1630(-)